MENNNLNLTNQNITNLNNDSSIEELIIQAAYISKQLMKMRK